MFTIIISETPQASPGPLFENQLAAAAQSATPPAPPIEHARIQVATLDVAALIALIYAKPKKARSDKGTTRAGK